MNRSDGFVIRPIEPTDHTAVAAIYAHYIEHSLATFEEVTIGAKTIALRVGAVHSKGLPWLVVESDGAVRGYAYATPWRSRSAYRFSVELAVYLAPDAGGQGLGTALYEALFEQLQRLGLRTVIAGISLPNPASVALHEAFGMHKVAHFEAVGFKFGQWVDVGYWQKTLGPQTPASPNS